MVEPLGILALSVLAFAAVPQTMKVLREGHAEGLSWFYLSCAWTGFTLMLLYTIVGQKGIILNISYVLQLVLFGLMIWRKAFPKKAKPRSQPGPAHPHGRPEGNTSSPAPYH